MNVAVLDAVGTAGLARVGALGGLGISQGLLEGLVLRIVLRGSHGDLLLPLCESWARSASCEPGGWQPGAASSVALQAVGQCVRQVPVDPDSQESTGTFTIFQPVPVCFRSHGHSCQCPGIPWAHERHSLVRSVIRGVVRGLINGDIRTALGATHRPARARRGDPARARRQPVRAAARRSVAGHRGAGGRPPSGARGGEDGMGQVRRLLRGHHAAARGLGRVARVRPPPLGPLRRGGRRRRPHDHHLPAAGPHARSGRRRRARRHPGRHHELGQLRPVGADRVRDPLRARRCPPGLARAPQQPRLPGRGPAAPGGQRGPRRHR